MRFILGTDILKNKDDGPFGAPIYGVSGLYDIDPALTRTDNAVGMRATVDQESGVVTSDFDNAFPWNESVVETINGNKFLHLPDMWFRIGFDSEQRITDVAVSKREGQTGQWYKVDSFYYGCYGGSIVHGKLSSVAGVTRDTGGHREYEAELNGNGYFSLDLYHFTVMRFLWMIEFANKSCRDIMNVSTQTLTNLPTGGTDSFTTPSGMNPTTKQMRYHYIEDFIGNNKDEVLNGIYGDGEIGGAVYVTSDISKYRDKQNYNRLAYNIPYPTQVNNMVTAIGWDVNNPFLVVHKEAAPSHGETVIPDQYFCAGSWKESDRIWRREDRNINYLIAGNVPGGANRLLYKSV